MSYPEQQRSWDPIGELQSLRSELTRLISGGGRGAFGAGIEMEQTDQGWVVTAALPGVAPDEVAVDIDGRELCIRARSEAEVNEEQGFGATGSRRRSFEYRLAVPSEVDPERIDATMDHGLLTVTLPRAERQSRRSINIGGRTGAPRVGSADPAAERELHHPHPQETASPADGPGGGQPSS